MYLVRTVKIGLHTATHPYTLFKKTRVMTFNSFKYTYITVCSVMCGQVRRLSHKHLFPALWYNSGHNHRPAGRQKPEVPP